MMPRSKRTAMRILTIFLVILACGQFACSSSVEKEEQAEVDLSASSRFTGSPQPVSQALVQYNGEESIEERIIRADTIVKARLDHITTEIVTSTTEGWSNEYNVSLKFHLTVSEYLKGSGANSITALWVGNPFEIRQEAEDVAPGVLASRDTSWDDREAILFFSSEYYYEPFSASVQGNDEHFLAIGGDHSRNMYTQDSYSLHDRYSKLWLPSASTTGTGDSQEFLLAVPEEDITTPTITVGELKSRIAAMNVELNVGDGSVDYRQCLSKKYRHMRIEEFRVTQPSYTGPSFDPGWDGVFASGQPAGSEAYEYYYGYIVTVDGTEYKTGFFLDGEDAALFFVTEGVHRPGRDEYITEFTYFVESVRPIPAGAYEFNHHYDGFTYCDIYTTFEMTANVAAPAGTLHEAFFDPVTVGTSVKADAANGVIKPTSFTIGETSTELTSLEWSNNQVVLTLNPHVSLSGHVLDFIELDGNVSLSLSASDATVDSTLGAHTWPVTTEPWQAGDKLMLRIREG